MIYTFIYCGNKFRFLNQIIEQLFIAKDLGCTHLKELFGGSGVVSLNATKIFNNITYNEIDEHINIIHNAFKNATYKEYNAFMKTHDVHNIDLTNKETYYAFRDTMNALYFMNDDINFGFASYYLVGACINSFVRFGPNGFNQSYGNRDLGKRFNEMSYNSLHNTYKSIDICNNDYTKHMVNDKSIVYFLDPPYEMMHSPYTNLFNKNKKDAFISFLTNELKDTKIIYTDAYSIDDWKILKSFGWKRHYLRNMQSIKPGEKNDNDKIIEVMYTNF